MASPFEYCPFDGSVLSQQAGTRLPVCPDCGFIDYGNPKPCVAVLIERDDGILLARRGVDPAKGKWDIPGGFIDAGETSEQAVIREIREETGLELTDIRYVMSLADIYAPRGEPTLNLCYFAKAVNWPPRADSDVAELQLVSADALPSWEEFAFAHQRLIIERWLGESSAPPRHESPIHASS